MDETEFVRKKWIALLVTSIPAPPCPAPAHAALNHTTPPPVFLVGGDIDGSAIFFSREIHAADSSKDVQAAPERR